MADGDPNLLQGDATVQQSLDHFEDQDVAKAVQTLSPRSGGGTNRWFDQTGTCPVVQLPVGDTGGTAGGGTTVARVFTQFGKVVSEQQTLRRDGYRTRVVPRFSGGVHAYLLANYSYVICSDGTAMCGRASITTWPLACRISLGLTLNVY